MFYMSMVDFQGTYVRIYSKPGTCECPLLSGLNPPNEGPLQSKQVIWVTGIYYKRVDISWVSLFVKDTSKLGEKNHNLKHCCSE